MDSETESQIYVQSPPQQQAQSNPPPADDPSPAAVPEGVTTHRPPPSTRDVDVDNITAKALKNAHNLQLRVLSMRFGNIPDVPIFTQWEKRADCCSAAVHRSYVAGICGSSRLGAYSVALSKFYHDDEDGGDVIIYTGTGGRKRWTDGFPQRRLRVGPQTEDQSWGHIQNKALIISLNTGNPVRVIRSWLCPSRYAPIQGYRYDGLYKVTACWTAIGHNGKNICRCRLERLPDQPPIPERPITLSASRRRPRERLVSSITSDPSTPPNPYDIPHETDVDIRPGQFNPAPAHLTGGTGTESSSPPQQKATSETFAVIDFNMGQADLGVKDVGLPSHQHHSSPKPGVLLRYRWDSTNNKLLRVPVYHPIQEDLGVAEGEVEEEHRGEDDATLVPSSESGRVDEGMETEYFSDVGNSP